MDDLDFLDRIGEQPPAPPIEPEPEAREERGDSLLSLGEGDVVDGLLLPPSEPVEQKKRGQYLVRRPFYAPLDHPPPCLQ